MISTTNPRVRAGYWTITELTEYLGLNYPATYTQIQMGIFPAPSHLLGKRKYYTPEQVQEIKKTFVEQ